MNTEKIRQTYKPRKVKLLLLGESPPASGRFFYVGDSAMLRHTRRAFEEALGWQCEGSEDFCLKMKSAGVFLDDLCHEPIDKLPSGERANMRDRCVPSLVSRLQEQKPAAIVVVMKTIEPHVKLASETAGFQGDFFALPFPGQGHQNEYVDGLTKALRDLKRKGLIN